MASRKNLVWAALAFTALLPWQAHADTYDFSFAGSGISGSLTLTYGSATDAKNPQAFEVTGISGTFSDSNNGLSIVNAPVGPLVPITRDTPEATNLLAPNDFSRFAVATGLDPVNNGFLTYDNLFYPNGSPPTASDYPLHGGVLDIYGLMFSIGDGKYVDLWSNGDITGSGTGAIYGAAVANHDQAFDYVGGVAAVPEPDTFVMLGGGLMVVGLYAGRRRRAK
ncbi:MAG: PEP-CTERM sorting domain-containing protein [Betaproteobacteria bacterium]|nr:PEP-CTERM sorting domain-containing protein [Betaproteobacteria bacterium]